jgi:hypothetical protein
VDVAHNQSNRCFRAAGFRITTSAFETEYAEVPELGGKISFRALLSLELNEMPPVIEL